MPVLTVAEADDYIPLQNPLQYDTIPEFLAALTNILIYFGLALVSFMVVLGGAFYMLGGVNPENVKRGKNIIFWTVVGLMVVILARAILAVISHILS